jgi:AraC-like DNA-binding protein
MKPLLLDVKSLLKDSIFVKEISMPQLNDRFHFHNAYEIALMIKSSGRRIIGDNIEDFTDGDIVLMGPHLPHVSYSDDAGKREVHALVIYFYPDWLTDTHVNSDDLTQLRELFEDMKRGVKIIGGTKQRVMKNILRLKNSKGLERIIKILEILEIISRSKEYVCLASEGYAKSYNQKDVNRMDKVYKYVMEHFTDDIMLEDIAEIANMTPTAFCKFFKGKTQKTFSNFVNEVRIGHARKLLYDDLNISEVCFQCGFNNLTNFNKNFKFFTKMSPSEFKTNLRLK